MGAFFFLLLLRLASRLESRLELGSADGTVRAFFESWGVDSGSDMARLEPCGTLLGPSDAGRVEEGIGRPAVPDTDGAGRGDTGPAPSWVGRSNFPRHPIQRARKARKTGKSWGHMSSERGGMGVDLPGDG